MREMVVMVRPGTAGSGSSAVATTYHRRADLSIERTLEEWRRLAFSDLGDFVDWGPDGVVIRSKAELTDEQRAAVVEVREHRRIRRTLGTKDKPPEEVEEREIRIKLHDKVQALVNISRYLGILADHAPPPAPTGLPRGFFAAFILRDPTKLQGVAPELIELPSETAEPPGADT